MAKCRIGRLGRVGLRDVWERERRDFAPWLAEPDNLALLGEAVGLPLEAPVLEKPVGGCRADIVCRDAATLSPVVIETQLERSDHCHLGQVVAYAAGIEASAAIWLAAGFRDLHRVALDRLNRQGGLRYFGVELEMWKLGDTAAPIFRVVSRPADPPPEVTAPSIRPAPARRAVRLPGLPSRPVSIVG